MTAWRATAVGLAAAAALALEAAFPAALRLGGEAPDLLAALAAATTGRAGGSLAAAALLGALRDAVSGGVAGRFAFGFLAAGVLLRAALGRLRERGLAAAISGAFVAALLAHGLAGAVSAALGRVPFGPVPGDALETAILTAVFAPAIVVPLAAAETLAGDDRPKPQLGARR